MPGTVRPVVDERDGLLAFLAQQRDGLRFAVHGLTDEQATSKPTVSALSLAGLIKHAARVERYWIVGILAQRPLPEMQTQDYEAGFRLEAGETLASVLDNYAATAAETEAIIGAIPDMGQPVPVPKGVPWFPRTSRRGPSAGCCSTSSRRWRGTPATPTSSANRWTARPCTS